MDLIEESIRSSWVGGYIQLPHNVLLHRTAPTEITIIAGKKSDINKVKKVTNQIGWKLKVNIQR